MKKAKKFLCAALAAVQAASLLTFSAAADDISIGTDTIAAGDSHSLVIKADLSLWAAGSNAHGQLGAGADVDTTDGIKVMDDIVSVDANGETSFAIDTSGTLYGWGDNTSGQVDPSQMAQYIYTPTKILENVVSVSAGDGHAVAITAGGDAYGWGSNANGELGFTANTQRNAVRKLMTDVADITAGDDFTMIVKNDGKLYVSGDNSNGQFGAGNYRGCRSFTATTMTDVIDVDAGASHVLVLKKDGTVYAAGLNDNKQVSSDTKTRVNSFVKLSLKDISSVIADENSSAAVGSNGSLYVWGANDNAQLLNGKTEDITKPTMVASGVISAAFGTGHSVMLKKDGKVVTAGTGMYGELFFFNDGAELKPVRVMENVTKYAAGADHAAAIVDGKLYTWGNNDCGQLGLGDTVARGTPQQVDLPAAAINVWCGTKYTFVQTADLRVFAFGDNTDATLGMNTKTTRVLTPVSNIMLADYKNIDIVCSKGFCIALLDGDVYGWGVNTSGRLCDLGKKVTSPELLSDDLNHIIDIAAGDNHGIALDSSGVIWGWGSNGSKQLGEGIEGVYITTPEMIDVYSKKSEEYYYALSIDAAANHSMAVANDGKIWVWGTNSYGQLGIEEYRTSGPTYVGYTADAVVAGRYTCGIIDNEKLMLCGSNKCGALGDGTEKDRSIFGTGTATASSADSADFGEYFGGYLRADGVLFCWGDNSVGQVGNGAGGICLEPKTVITDALCAELSLAEGIKLNKSELVIKPNATAKLTATVTPADADIKTVKWSSSNAKVATVSSNGTVKGVSYGTAVITATTAGGVKATCEVTVTIPVTSFSVTPSKSKTLNIGQSFTFKAKTYPTNAIDNTLLYESSDPSVATVNALGKVTALSAGAATITVTAKSNPAKVRTVKIYVRPAKASFSYKKASADGVLLKWKAVDGADGYTVYRRSTAKGASTVIADVASDEAFTVLDANAVSGKTYYYFIRAYVEVNGKKYYSSSYALYKIKAK